MPRESEVEAGVVAFVCNFNSTLHILILGREHKSDELLGLLRVFKFGVQDIHRPLTHSCVDSYHLLVSKFCG